ncbi:MAG: OmpA family protein [Rickettsiales bacterium]|jgi:outer membrane protein OmpA-like peptidoglycan-associated protein|nr:OmpA family protein [Rickettsiales bacterium]
MRKALVLAALLAFAAAAQASRVVFFEQDDYLQSVANTDFYNARSPDKFANSLSHQYKSLALFRANTVGDIRNGEHFARKAINAYYGERVRPDPSYSRNVQNDVIEIANAYDDVMKFLNDDLADAYPVLMAEMQVKYDCWAEALEDGSRKQASVCRDRFLYARNLLVEKTREPGGCAKKTCGIKTRQPVDSSVRAEQAARNSERALNIPKWPEMSVITMNPPRMRDTSLIKTEKELAELRSEAVKHDSKVSGELEELKRGMVSLSLALESYTNASRPGVISGSEGGASGSGSADAQLMGAILKDISERAARIEAEVATLGSKGIAGGSGEGANIEFAKLSNEIRALSAQSAAGGANEDTIRRLGEIKLALDEISRKIDSMPAPVAAAPVAVPMVVSAPATIVEAEYAEEEVYGEEPLDEEEYEEEDEDYLEDEDVLADSGFMVIEETDYVETPVVAESSDVLPYELYFEWDRDNVRGKYMPELADVTTKALASEENIVVQGHTDTSGTHAHNLDLSNRRAVNVAKVLEERGVEKSRIIIQAMAESDLKVQTGAGVRNELNRRVVIK